MSVTWYLALPWQQKFTVSKGREMGDNAMQAKQFLTLPYVPLRNGELTTNQTTIPLERELSILC